jgi:hypothetical protein
MNEALKKPVKMRGVRISDELWNLVKRQAESQHRSVGMHVVYLLENSVKCDDKLRRA